MSDEAVGGGPDGAGAAFVGDGGVFAFGGGILEEGEEGGAVEKSWFFEAAEVTEGGEEVSGFYDVLRAGAGLGDLWADDDEGGVEGFFKEGVFSPDGVLAEVPAVVSPEDDDGVIGETEVAEFLDDLSDLGISIADAGGVVLADLGGEFWVVIWVFPPAVVFHEFAGAVPSGLSFGFLGV